MCGSGQSFRLHGEAVFLGQRLLQIFQLAEIERQQDHIGKEPGQRMGKAHRPKAVAAHKTEGHQRPGHQLGKTGEHGGVGKAHALQAVAEDEDDGQEGVGKAVDHQIIVNVRENGGL